MEVQMPGAWRILLALLFIPPSLSAQEAHSHAATEILGKVSFPVSCSPAVQEQFNRGVALLHSFAYSGARDAFERAVELDPKCAVAHWGMAMSYFHQLWAQQIGASSQRERQFINALRLIYDDPTNAPYGARTMNYEHAMSDPASENSKDV